MLSIERLMKEALSLPNALIAQLAERLVESLEFDIDGTVQKLWTAEAKQRRDEIRSGIVEPIPEEEALDRKSTRLNSSHVSQSRMPSSA